MSSSSLRRFFAYLGPALIVSMAYMDPGNYGTDILGGAVSNYDLLWAVWLASLMAMVLQYLSGKLGISTGKSLPELIRTSFKSRAYIVPYWLAAEAAVAATDLAEYLGTVIALNLLFGIPLLYASIFGALDVLILLAFVSRRFRVIEYLFMLFVSIISIGFLYEMIVAGVDPGQIALHTLSPSLPAGTLLIVVGIVGATVMPHALYVHSWLTKNKLQENTIEEKRRLRRLHMVESVSTLTIAGLANAAILVTSAVVLFPQFGAVCQPPSGCPQPTVDDVYVIMAPLYGALAAVVFAVTLLSSGLASSMTGTLAGISIMDGLLGTKVNVYLRRLVTRFINVFPTTIAIILGLDPLSLLVYSQVILSLMIPLPMVPLIYYSSRRKFMGEFVNRKVTTAVALASATVIIVLNVFLLLSFG
ncbi:MAG: Nramp family divalent metal transporter [Thaumarchaeota archaeon]|nr:Nramp family divalent metal transporter [Nitrososphaerota archaeon]